MEVRVIPSHNFLNDMVQLGQRDVARDLYPPPNRRTDVPEGYLDLTNSQWVIFFTSLYSAFRLKVQNKSGASPLSARLIRLQLPDSTSHKVHALSESRTFLTSRRQAGKASPCCYHIYDPVNVVCITALSLRHAPAGARKIVLLLIRSLEGTTDFPPLATGNFRQK